MRKWIKRTLLVVAILIVGSLAVLYGGFRMIRSTPAWYRHYSASLADREAATQRAFNKFAGIQNAAAGVRRDEIVARNAHSPPAAPADQITVTFTDDELNAFFQTWADHEGWKENYGSYIEDPVIILRENHIIFAAQVKDLDTLASVHLEPTLDEQGRLDLRLVDVLGGRLSLPDAIVAPYKRRAIAAMKSRLPHWQSEAALAPDGSANGDLIAASFARLLVHTLEGTPADPVLFLPLVEHRSNVPVKITGVKVQDHVLTVTVQPLDTAARAALLERIHQDEPTP